MTNWKAKMLDELYVAADRFLSDDGASSLRGSRAEEVREQVRALCPERGEREFLDHFLAAVPERYLYANDADDIVRHSRFARQAQHQSLSVTLMTVNEPYVELGFIAEDRPGLLAMMTATLAAARLKVVAAQIYSWKDVYGRMRALDLFWVRGGNDSNLVRAVLPRIERDFARLLGGETQPSELVIGRSKSSRLSERPTPGVATEVAFDNRASADHTLIEVTTRDRIGLLFTLANTLLQQKLTISLAKINTEGNRVADVFYVTDVSGAKVSEPERLEEIRQRITGAIELLQAEGAS
jgi:[protein-PII] uridylyltransferase